MFTWYRLCLYWQIGRKSLIKNNPYTGVPNFQIMTIYKENKVGSCKKSKTRHVFEAGVKVG